MSEALNRMGSAYAIQTRVNHLLSTRRHHLPAAAGACAFSVIVASSVGRMTNTVNASYTLTKTSLLFQFSCYWLCGGASDDAIAGIKLINGIIGNHPTQVLGEIFHLARLQNYHCPFTPHWPARSLGRRGTPARRFSPRFYRS